MTANMKENNLVSVLDLPADLNKQVPRLVLWGDKHLLIENYGSLQTFSPGELRIYYGTGELHIIGENLILEVLTKSEIEICGKITEISITEAKNGAE